MIGYITLGTNDLDRATSFYKSLLSEIGIEQIFKTDKMIAWGKDFNSTLLMLTIPYNDKPQTIGNGCMVALKVDSP